jgi:hypothetical protein
MEHENFKRDQVLRKVASVASKWAFYTTESGIFMFVNHVPLYNYVLHFFLLYEDPCKRGILLTIPRRNLGEALVCGPCDAYP